MVVSKPGLDEATRGKLLLILLAFFWGLSWPALRVALDGIPGRRTVSAIASALRP